MDKQFISIIKKKSKLFHITTAIALYFTYQTYKFFCVPRVFRKYTKVSTLSLIISFLVGHSPIQRFQQLVLPRIKDGQTCYVSKVPFDWRLNIVDPVVAKQMLLKSENFPKDQSFLEDLGESSIFNLFFGIDNIAVSNGAMWKSQRKAMNPAFHRKPPLKVMENTTRLFFSVIEENEGRIKVAQEMRKLALDILGHAIFDIDFRCVQGDIDDWSKTYNMVVETVLDPVFNIFPSLDFLIGSFYPKRIRGVKAVDKLFSKFNEIIKNKRAAIENGSFKGIPDSEKDILTLMLESGQRGDSMKTEDELMHNVIILFAAGHDTTSNTLAFCLYHLAKNKDIQQKLREEVSDLLGNGNDTETITLEMLNKMKYLNAVIKENLRMNVPADFLFPRRVLENMNLSGTFFQKDTVVSVDLNAIHHNPKYWKNPEKFIPERFMEKGEQESHEGLTWLPFSNGFRQCIGMNFSLAEQRIVLAMIVHKYELDVPQDSKHYNGVIIDTVTTTAPNSLELLFTKRY
ncbi:cytochrome P450 [Sporodiniella umbellata]|nr:cytochrome P450 [Sporodiniella umbellata]